MFIAFDPDGEPLDHPVGGYIFVTLAGLKVAIDDELASFEDEDCVCGKKAPTLGEEMGWKASDYKVYELTKRRVTLKEGD